MSQLFISYSRKDEEFAHRVSASLLDLGADIWMDKTEIHVAEIWSDAIQRGLDECGYMLLIISPDSMESRNVGNEWQYFVDQNKTIVPILWKPAKVHFQLGRIQYIDFHTQDFDTAFKQLHSELRRKGVQLQNIATDDREVRVPIQAPLPDRSRGSKGRMVALVSGVVILLLVGSVLLISQFGRQPSSLPSPTSNIAAQNTTPTLLPATLTMTSTTTNTPTSAPAATATQTATSETKATTLDSPEAQQARQAVEQLKKSGSTAYRQNPDAGIFTTISKTQSAYVGANATPRNFILDITFVHSPTLPNMEYFGVFFKSSETTDYNLNITYGGRWIWFDNRDFKIISEGSVYQVNNAPNARNQLEVAVDDTKAYVFLNGSYVTTLSLRADRGTGMLGLIVGVYNDDLVPASFEASPTYKDFILQNLP